MEGLDTIVKKHTDSIKSPVGSPIDPVQFDMILRDLLRQHDVGAEQYVDIFKQHNIGQNTLPLLSDADLMKLGVADAQTRKNIMKVAKELPVFFGVLEETPNNNRLSLQEITDILKDNTLHLHRVYLSLLYTTKSLSKDGVPDSLLYKDKYASDVALSTVNEMINIMDSIESILRCKLKVPEASNQKKKITVGAIGSAVIVILSILFVKSLKHLK